MDSIKEALTFDDVTLAPNYSEILPSQVNTSINLTSKLNINFVYKTSFDKANRTSLSSERGIGIENSIEVFENYLK